MMDTPVRLRPATAADIPRIVGVFRSARRAAMPWLPVLHTAAGDASFFANRVLPVQTTEVAEMNNTLVGFLAHQDDWVNHLYVSPEAWRQGVGSRLLRWTKRDRETLQLWVFERNRAAQAFYIRHGFVVVERTDGANNQEKCPDLRMAWTSGDPRPAAPA